MTYTAPITQTKRLVAVHLWGERNKGIIYPKFSPPIKCNYPSDLSFVVDASDLQVN